MRELRTVVNECIDKKFQSCNKTIDNINVLENVVVGKNSVSDVDPMTNSHSGVVNPNIVINNTTQVPVDQAVNSDTHSIQHDQPVSFSSVLSNNLINTNNVCNSNVTKQFLSPKHLLAPNNVSEEVVIVASTNDDHSLTDMHETVTEVLDNIPVSFVRVNDITKKITIGFPNKNIQRQGEFKLKNAELLKADGITVSQPKKMLPKLTITNIPTDIFTGIDIEDTNNREDVKSILKTHILKKNAYAQELVDLNHTLDVVYINANNNERFCTSAIKVSPLIRTKIIFENGGYVYIGNSKCQVSDRFFYKQCYHCQQIGHISKDCPSSKEKPICMYCSESHSTRFCRKKHQKDEHRCVNCAKSRSHDIFSKCTDHNSGSSNCPLAMREVQRLQKNTEMFSKNVM